ncbi:MAG TPA: hypothetical protein VL688_03395 [Verrucomicrobiae bacterium]|jgi:hypothetical protein|nr:hypothetical protein [Verrucomicrobiae bacterium]
MRHKLSFLFYGGLLILTAFWAGSQKDMTLGLIGFLPFFTLGVLLIIQGLRKPVPPGEKTK